MVVAVAVPSGKFRLLVMFCLLLSFISHVVALVVVCGVVGVSDACRSRACGAHACSAHACSAHVVLMRVVLMQLVLVQLVIMRVVSRV